MRIINLVSLCASLVLLVSCGGGGSDNCSVGLGVLVGSSGGCNAPAAPINSPPVARIGSLPGILTGDTVTLDGSNSSDSNQDTLAYKWVLRVKPEGSAALLSSVPSAKPTITPDLFGIYVAALVVNDGHADSATAEVTLTVADANALPMALPGITQTVRTGSTVKLNGSNSVDVKNRPLSYKWILTLKPEGSTAALSSESDIKPSFIADATGVYAFRLMVNNGVADSEAASVAVIAVTTNVPPVAVAGATQNVLVGTTITLNGSKSTDSENSILSYKWLLFSKPTGSAAALALGTSAKPSFLADLSGTYIASLVVNDGTDNSEVAAVVVTAGVGNIVPVADPGSSQVVNMGELVKLDGSASSDANHDTLFYSWRLLSSPSGSTASLSSGSVVNPTFTADKAGTYVASLVVNDGTFPSAAVSIAVTCNAPPTANAGTDQSVTMGALVKLDGSASTDVNNDMLSYRWQMIGRPIGSASGLISNAAVKPTFTADLTGDYSITLVVNDGMVDSEVVTIKVTAMAN